MENNKKTSKPFYALPEKIATSSQIVNAARSSLRTYDTTRPRTPREEQRHLFPSSTNRTPESRPPSSFSLSSRHFDGPDSRPVSGTRLSPLDHHPKPGDVENILVPRPPADQSKSTARRGSSNRARISSAASVDGLENQVNPDLVSSPDDPSKPDVGRAPAGVPLPSSAGSNDSRSGSAGSRKSSAGKSSRNNSAGKREAEDAEDVYSSRIEPLVTELSTLTKKRDCDRIYELAEELYSELEESHCFSKQYARRSYILKVIFKLLDVDEPNVLLRLARLILAFKVSGNNLLNVCKLVFKVSRNDKNDVHFMEKHVLSLILETIRTADPATSYEALIYCVGSIKFLTGNAEVLKRLARLDCIKTLAVLMHAINKINQDTGKANDQYGHILVQLAAALRNLADLSSGRDRFLTHHVIEGLVGLMDSYPGDSDLMLYISRILSKVTLHSDCCSVLADQPISFKVFVSLLKRHMMKDDLIVRLCFVLGNLTIKNDGARRKLFRESDSLNTLLAVFKTYLELDLQGKTSSQKDDNQRVNGDAGGDRESEISKVEDVLIKIMRVLANLSINEDVGPEIAEQADFIAALLQVVEHHDVDQHEELVVNAVVAINNVSYYTSQDLSQMECHQQMANALLKLVLTNNMEAMMEAARVFGNLTRHKQIRDFLSDNKVDAMMVTLLDSGHREMVYSACGVLINFMLDQEKRPLLMREGGVKKLIDVLRDFGQDDWQLSGCVCKLLVNYSTGLHSSENSFGQDESMELAQLLAEYLDKDLALRESASGAPDEEMREFVEDSWHDEFQPVASQLLKRIESHSSPLEPLDAPS